MAAKSSDFTRFPCPYTSGNKAFLYLLLLALFAFLFNLGGRPIEAKDYPRYAEIAREILEFNDWVMLRLQGKIYVEKPPLHFWMIAGSYKLFGVNPFAARLPSAMAAFCGVLLTFFFVRKFFGNTETAFLAAIILLSTYDFLWWARRTRIDMVFSVLFSASLVFFYCGCESTSNRHKALWYLAFWLATGCAFMDKAFIAFANLVVVIPYAAMATFKPEGRKVSPGLMAATSPILLLPILPWMIALVHHAEFSAFWEILGRTKIMDRREAFYFYLIQMPVKLFPATPFLAMGIWGFVRYRKQLDRHRELGFALLWVVSYLFILHLTAAKSTRYLLPLYLPCSLMSAWAIRFFLSKSSEMLGTVLKWGDRVFLVFAALGLAFPFAIACYYDVKLTPALLNTLSLGVALLIGRKLLPFKSAGIFVSFIILMLVIEVGDTVAREKMSAYYRMSVILKNEKLETAQIAFQKCDGRAHTVMSFYFDKLLHCSDSWTAIRHNPQIRAIVTTSKAIEEEIPSTELEKTGRIIPCGKGYVVVIKPD
jgi:4-amino-4-deoxy-L-arabinose transferase-like glycosyltransferase